MQGGDKCKRLRDQKEEVQFPLQVSFSFVSLTSVSVADLLTAYSILFHSNSSPTLVLSDLSIKPLHEAPSSASGKVHALDTLRAASLAGYIEGLCSPSASFSLAASLHTLSSCPMGMHRLPWVFL